MELVLPPSCFILYMDETGHEEFADPKYPLFGIGGCAAVLDDYDALIKDPWIRLKKEKLDGVVKLHAADLKNLTPAQMEALGRFFRDNHFARFASVIKKTAEIPDEITAHKLVAESLLKRIEKISAPFTFNSVAFVFEASERTDKLLRRNLPDIQVVRNGQKLPVHTHVMPKETGEVGLEVADFVIHTAGSQAREYMESGSWKARKDFDAVFNGVPGGLSSHFIIEGANLDIK